MLIPDVRYQDEVERIAQAGGLLWKVDRDVQGHLTGHASEKDLAADWDLIVDNNGSIDDLTDYVRSAFSQIAEDVMNNRIEKAVRV